MKKELYLLPYAGGTSFSYSRWRFDEGIDVHLIDYKGHGSRLKETLDSSFENLVDDVTKMILNQTDGKDVNIFGHSMGGLVAWDIVNNLRRKGISCRNLIVSACVPPHLFNFEQYKVLATENGLLNFLKQEQRLSEKQIDSKMFREVVCPASINDYRLLTLYRRTKWEKADIQIACLYGNRDSMIDIQLIDKWHDYSSICFKMFEFDGDHYYIEDQRNISKLEIVINNLICCD